MLYRLFDNERKRWIRNFYISPLGDVVIPKKSLFGTKLSVALDTEYVYHMNTGLCDKNGNYIYEGDICELDVGNRNVAGVVAYVESDGSYYVLDNYDARYYPLSQVLCDERVEVIGNVFDGIREDKKLEERYAAEL